MHSLLRNFDALVAEQDYFWFLAGVAWLALAAFALARRSRPEAHIPAWLLAAAFAATAYAAASIFLMVARRNIYATARWQDDLLLAAPLAVGAGALAWGAWRGPVRWLMLAALAAALAGRVAAYHWSAHGVAIVTALAGWRLAARCGESADAASASLRRIAVALLVALPLLSPAGPLAIWIGETQRWNRLPRLGLPCAMVCFTAALIWLWVCLRPATRSWGWGANDETERRDLRRFGAALLAWLVAGFVLTGFAGSLARASFEQSLLAQARLGAALIDTRRLAECLGPALRLAPPTAVTDPSGTTERFTVSPHLSAPRLAPLRASLTVIQRAVDQSLWTHVITHRDGWLASIAFDERVPVHSGEIPLHHPLNPRDYEAWAARRAYVAGPIAQWGMHMSARAPLRDDQGRMLGWLAVDIPIDLWITAQTQARAQSLILTGTGVALGLLIFGLRLRSRERQAAEQAAAEALRAEQRQTVFLAKVSHELRTPIQNILGYAQLVRPAPGDSLALERLDAVRSQGALLIRLVNDLVDLSAAQAGEFRLQPRPSAVFALIAEAVESLRPRAEAKGLALHVEFSRPDAGHIFCDPERLRQIVTNLVGNAVKFTRQGWVRVSVRLIEPDSPSPRCEVLVADSGPGIALADQTRLFRPFERLAAEASAEGSGLGLALTRRICEAMGGTLELESDGRTGSSFRATFAAPPSAAAPVSAPAAMPVPESPALRLLIADDNILVRRLFRAWLEPFHAAVAEAVDGDDAYRRVHAAPPDVLLVDIAMPGLNGIELTRRLRHDGFLSDRLWIVGISAHLGESDHQSALAAGMNLLLQKPVDAPALLAALAARRPTAHLEATPSGGEKPSLAAALHTEFRSLAPRLAAELRTAADRLDWERLALTAHELANCAFALQERELGDDAALLEQAARRHEPPPAALLARIHEAFTRLAPLSALTPKTEFSNPPPSDHHEFVPLLRRQHPPPPGRN